MVLQQGEWDFGPDTLDGGVRIERGPRGNSLGNKVLSLVGAFLHGFSEGLSDDGVNPSVSWRERPRVYPMTPRLELRARHQARVRGQAPEPEPEPEPNYTDPVEAWLALQQAERVRDLASSPRNTSVTKAVKAEIAADSEVREAFNPVNTMTIYEKPAPSMPNYAGELIANDNFTDPNVTRWYPNSAELYEQERARVRAELAEQREQQMLQAMRQANPAQTLGARTGQELRMDKRAPQKKSSGVTIRKKTLRELAREVNDYSLRHLQDPHYQGKLSYEAQQLLRQQPYDWRHEPGVVDITFPTALDVASAISLVGPTYQGITQLPKLAQIIKDPRFWTMQLPQLGRSLLRSKQVSGLGISYTKQSAFDLLRRDSAVKFSGIGEETIKLLKNNDWNDKQIVVFMETYGSDFSKRHFTQIYRLKNGEKGLKMFQKGFNSEAVYIKIIKPNGKVRIGFAKTVDPLKGIQYRITDGPIHPLVRPKDATRTMKKPYYFEQSRIEDFLKALSEVEKSSY